MQFTHLVSVRLMRAVHRIDTDLGKGQAMKLNYTGMDPSRPWIVLPGSGCW